MGAMGSMTGAPVPRLSSWWRLWLVQGSWNRRDMQNLGWLVALLPWLRDRDWDETRKLNWVRSHRGYSNSNPYLLGLILGVVARLEQEGEPELARKLSDGLSRSLGSIGDALFWTGVRPALGLLLALMALRWGPIVALAGWLLFAALQAALRMRCLDEGFRRGTGVVELLGGRWVHRSIRATRRAALLAAGLLGGQLLWVLVAGGDGRVVWSPASLATPPILAIEHAVAVALATGTGTLAAWRGWDIDRVVLVSALALWSGFEIVSHLGGVG